MMDLLLILIISGFAGVGFSVLVQASPLGRLTFKPFVCRTCLSGWGSIFASGLLLHGQGHLGLSPCALGSWALLAFAGTGLAHLTFGLADPKTPASMSFDETLPEPPIRA